MDERKNQFIVGGVIVVVVIVVIGLIAMKSSDPVCELQAVQPKPDLTKLKTISSADNNALLRFAGYVKYELDPKSEDKKVYLALNDAKSVVLKKADKDNKNSLGIDADCATMALSVDDGAQSKEIGSVTMDLVKPNGDNKSCTMFIGAVYAKDKHYSCNKEKSYPCTIKTKDSDNKEIVTTVATLSISSLEFEINGDPEKVKKGEFTTPAEECQ